MYFVTSENWISWISTFSRTPYIVYIARHLCDSTAFSLFDAIIEFLADRANGRTYATVLRPSVVVDASSSVTVIYMYCGKMVRPRAKVTIESL